MLYSSLPEEGLPKDFEEDSAHAEFKEKTAYATTKFFGTSIGQVRERRDKHLAELYQAYEQYGATNNPVFDQLLQDGLKEIETLETTYLCDTVPMVDEYYDAQAPDQQIPIWRPAMRTSSSGLTS